jgi:hypothetical protein
LGLGQAGTAGLLGAIWAAVQAIFIRAGIANEVQNQGVRDL